MKTNDKPLTFNGYRDSDYKGHRIVVSEIFGGGYQATVYRIIPGTTTTGEIIFQQIAPLPKRQRCVQAAVEAIDALEIQ